MADAVAQSAPAGEGPASENDKAERRAEAFSGGIYAVVALSFVLWVVLLVILQRAFA